MDLLDAYSIGFSFVFGSWHHFLFIILGVTVGTVVGILPGLGATSGLALLLPTVFSMNAGSALMMLTGCLLGTTFGGALTAIILNIPGTPSSALSALEGYQLSQKGRGGVAVGIAAISGTIGAVTSTTLAIFLAPIITKIAISFGPVEYCSLIVLGLSTVAFLGTGSTLKALFSAALGFVIGMVGADPMGGVSRFTFNQQILYDGVSFVVVTMGVFALAEVLLNLEKELKGSISGGRLIKIYPAWNDLKSCLSVWAKAPVIGFFVGVLPAAGMTVAAFMSYAIAKKTSRRPERFGTGILEGIAAVETADAASAPGAFVPLMTLGIPGSGSTAIMLGAMIMFGLRPGPLMFAQTPGIAWGVLCSLYVATLFLLILNLPLAPFFARIILALPYVIIYPIILLFILVGAFALENNVYNVYLMIGFGILGYFMQKLDIPRAPMLLSLVLGPLFERSLRQSLMISKGNIGVFFSEPVSALLLGLTVLIYFSPFLLGFIGKYRKH